MNCKLCIYGEPLVYVFDRDNDTYVYPPIKKTVGDVLEVVSRFTGIGVPKITGQSRLRNIVYARYLVCYLSKTLELDTLRNIGICLGGRDHTTVINAKRKIQGWIDVYPETRNDVSTLMLNLK